MEVNDIKTLEQTAEFMEIYHSLVSCMIDEYTTTPIVVVVYCEPKRSTKFIAVISTAYKQRLKASFALTLRSILPKEIEAKVIVKL